MCFLIQGPVRLFNQNSRGMSYIETMIALAIVAMITTSLMPHFPKLLSATKYLERQAKLVTITDYIGEYLFRWINFSPYNKHKFITEFADGDELEIVGETRVNHLAWAEPLTLGDEAITDHYKTSITFWETATNPTCNRDLGAVVKVVVWYDTNLDNLRSADESYFSFSTIVTEKRDL